MLDISSSKENITQNNPSALITESEISGLNKIDNSKIIVIFSFVAAGLFLAMSIFVFALATSKDTQFRNIESNYTSLVDQLKSDQNLSKVSELASKFANGLDKINSFIANRATWSVFLAEIQKITPSDIIYKTINVTEKTYITTISGEASSYSSVKMLLANLINSDKFKNIKLISSTQVEGEVLKVNFVVEVQVVDKKLRSTI